MCGVSAKREFAYFYLALFNKNIEHEIDTGIYEWE